jgi:nucleotide-binding universal stress UspA family protein
MAKILFPTDFSEASEASFPYARSFAEFLKRDIELVHYYHPVMNDLSGVDYNLAKELQDMKTEQMANFASRLDHKDVTVTTTVQVGFPVQTLVERSKEESTTLIIMSTRGEKNALDRWLGSISSEVSVKSHCPVILVPPGTTKIGLENVVYATSHEALNEKSIRRLQNLIQQLGAAVHFCYVAPEGAQTDTVKNEIIDILFADGEPNFSFSIHLIEDESPVEGINEYVSQNETDLIIMYNVDRGFWEGILHRSISKEMSFNSKAPLLIMHSKDHD